MSDSESYIEDNAPLGQLGQNARHRQGFPDSDSDTEIYSLHHEAVVDLQQTADQDQQQQANLLHVPGLNEGEHSIEVDLDTLNRDKYSSPGGMFLPRPDPNNEPRTPFDFFSLLIPTTFYTEIAEQTYLFARQRGADETTFTPTNADEIRAFIGLYDCEH